MLSKLLKLLSVWWLVTTVHGQHLTFTDKNLWGLWSKYDAGEVRDYLQGQHLKIKERTQGIKKASHPAVSWKLKWTTELWKLHIKKSLQLSMTQIKDTNSLELPLIYQCDLTDSSLAKAIRWPPCGLMCLDTGQPKHTFDINHSSQSKRLLRDWEEMGPNRIRLWPGHACMQPCHSILLCDCDHSRHTGLIAGNK